MPHTDVLYRKGLCISYCLVTGIPEWQLGLCVVVCIINMCPPYCPTKEAAFFFCCGAVLTVTGIQDLNRCRGRKLNRSHHRLRQQDLEGLRLLVLPVSQYPNPPRGPGLSRVELHLPLGLALEILLLLGAAVLGADA